MEFNAKFFFTAFILALAASMLSHLGSWLLRLYRFSPGFYSWIILSLAPIQFAVGVALPFAVMYILSTRVTSKPTFKPIIASTFLGCWIGQLTTLTVDTSITFLSGGSYGSDYFQLIFWIIWQIFTSAFSSIFFISLAAILFAYYQNNQQNTHKHPNIFGA